MDPSRMSRRAASASATTSGSSLPRLSLISMSGDLIAIVVGEEEASSFASEGVFISIASVRHDEDPPAYAEPELVRGADTDDLRVGHQRLVG